MREADHIIDMGPLASHLGGEVIAVGNYDEWIDCKWKKFSKYLSEKLKIEVPKFA
jgi:excinuclease ABC subunit A